MKKMLITLMFLMIGSIFIFGCSSKPICGDGICSIDEDALNNCAEDCNKNPDIVVNKIWFSETPSSYQENTLNIVLKNTGFALGEISGELELYHNGERYTRRTIDFRDYDFDNVVNVEETVTFKENIWLSEPGVYKIKFNTNVLNKEDLSPTDNYQEIDFEVAKQSYPKYLIEEKIGNLDYQYSKIEDNSYHALDFANNIKSKTYVAEYNGYNADESDVYMNGNVAVTTYDKEINAAEFNKKINEYASNEGRYAYLNKWNNYLVYTISSDDYHVYESYWISGNKLIHFYSYSDWTDSRYKFIEAYTEKHQSSIPITINCGNNQCDSNYMSIEIEYYKSIITLDYEVTYEGANVYTDPIEGDQYNISFDISGVKQTLTPYKNSVAMIDNKYINFQVLDFYKYESCEYNTDSATINFIGIGTKQGSNGSAIDMICGIKFNEECDMGNGITVMAYGAYDKEVYFSSSPDNGWVNIKVGETRLIGNTKIRLDYVDGVEKTNCNNYGRVGTNVGENYRTCPNDCLDYQKDRS